jgi:plasmid stability protein
MEPFWSYTGAMAVSLSIKDVPDRLARALRDRAARNHRSIQGELMHIIEQAVEERPFRAKELVERLRAIRLPAGESESTPSSARPGHAYGR